MIGFKDLPLNIRRRWRVSYSDTWNSFGKFGLHTKKTFSPKLQKSEVGKRCDNSAGTETYFSLPVFDLSLISEAWSGKAIWAKTDIYSFFVTGRGKSDKFGVTHPNLTGIWKEIRLRPNLKGQHELCLDIATNKGWREVIVKTRDGWAGAYAFPCISITLCVRAELCLGDEHTQWEFEPDNHWKDDLIRATWSARRWKSEGAGSAL